MKQALINFAVNMGVAVLYTVAFFGAIYLANGGAQ